MLSDRAPKLAWAIRSTPEMSRTQTVKKTRFLNSSGAGPQNLTHVVRFQSNSQFV
jgi:hypothetical protein